MGHNYNRPRIELAVDAEWYAKLLVYARRHGLTVPGIVRRYLERLVSKEPS
jgi:hypothetical protein